MTTPLPVPYYRQTMDFSCGPAAVLMALGHFGCVEHLDRDLEVDIFRETTAVEVGGADRFGLSVPLARHGLYPHIISDARGLGFLGVRLRDLDIDHRAVRFFHRMQRRRAARLGVTAERRRPRVGDLRAALERGELPLVLVSTWLFGDADDIPHWVVVTAVTDDTVRLHNPLDPPRRAHRCVAVQRLFETRRPYNERTVVLVGQEPHAGREPVAEPAAPKAYLDYDYRRRES